MTGAAPERVHREVVSFVRRSARMTPGQARAWNAHAERYLVDVPRGPTRTSVAPTPALPPTELFGRDAPLIVEIGPGPGDSLVPLAQAHPEADVLVFEVYQPAVAALLGRLAGAGLDNVRVVSADAVDGLRWLLAAGSVAELWTFFPDPWPKVRHHKRRLINPAFADLAAGRLNSGGIWRLATDSADYASVMQTVVGGHPAFVEHPADDWTGRPMTRFEARAQTAGREIVELAFRRR